MKLLKEDQIAAHDSAVQRGALEGTAAGAGLAVAASFFARKRYPGYTKLPLSLKALGAAIIVAPCLAIQAERRGLEYERSQWEGEGVRILSHKEVAEANRWDAMTTSEKIGDWSFRHQYTLIMGGWAASLALAGGIISRNKYQTQAQKIVQARMWAQGLTIGLLIAAGALTSKRRAATAAQGQTDHSWQDVLEQQERDRRVSEEVAKARASSSKMASVAS